MKQILLKTWLILVCLLTGAGTMWGDSYTITFKTGSGDGSSVSTSTKCSDIVTAGSDFLSGNVATATKVYSAGGSGLKLGTSSDQGIIKMNLSITGHVNATTIVVRAKQYSSTKATKLAVNGKTAQNLSADFADYTFTLNSYITYLELVSSKGTSGGAYCWIESITVNYGTPGGSTPDPEPTKYTVTVDNNIANGTVTASPTSAAEGTEVTLTASPATGYEFGSWNVTNASNSESITVTDSKFTMPAANVNVSATFNAVQGGGDEPSGDRTTVTWIASEQSYTNGVQYTSATVDEYISLAFGETANDGKYYTTGSGIRIYANGKVTVSAAKNATISKIVLTYSASDYAGTFSANTGSYSISFATGTWTGFANSVVLTNTASSGHARIQKIAVSYSAEGGDTPSKTDPTLSFVYPIYNATVGEDFTAPTLTNPQNVTVSYSSSKTDVATVNSETGAVELVGAGTTTITASFAGDKDYYSTSASYDLVVAPAPFASLEDLVAAYLVSGTNVTVSLENVAIKSIYTSSQSKRLGVYFDIQKDGHDIEIYYSSTEVPEEWVAGGTLSGTMTNCPWKLYSSTWQLAPGSGWAWTNLTYTAPANCAPTITTQPVSATYEWNAAAKNLIVEASGNPAPTYQWYSNTTNSNENGTELEGATNASYKPSTATAGTFYYYCVATNSEGSATSSVATITVKEPVVASLPFAFDGGKNDITNTDGMSQTGLGSDYSSSPKLKFDDAKDNVVINFNEAAKKVTYVIKGNSMSGTNAFDVMESADGVEYTMVHSHSFISDVAFYTHNLKAESRFVKFVYTTKASGNVALGNISIVAASVAENPDLAFEQSTYTFFTDADNMQVVATSAAGSTGAITYALTEGDDSAFLIDENTGDIVCETAGTYTVTATIAEAAGFTSGTATCTVKVVEPVVGNSIIVAEADGNYYAMTTTVNGTYFVSQAINKVGDKYVVSSLDNILFCTRTTDGKTTIQNATDAQYVQATAAKNISYTENEYQWTNAEGVLTAENAEHGTLQYNTGSPRFTTYTSKVGQYATIVDLSNVVIGNVVIGETLSVSDAGYATYYNEKAYVMPEGLEGKIMEAVNDGYAATTVFKVGDVVPAETALLLKGDKGDYPLIVTTGEADPDNVEYCETYNLLHGNLTKGLTTGGSTYAKYYKLAKGYNGLGWYYGSADNTDGHAFEIEANKAYLVLENANSARFIQIEGDTLTAINGLDTDVTNEEIYDLAGRRVQRVNNGMYILNGKKVIF